MPTKVHIEKAMVFLVVMYGCESWDIKEGWALKSWCFWMVVLEKEKTLESPLDSQIKPVNPKGNQPWIIIVKTETPILWPPDRKSWLIVKKNPDAGKDWRQKEKGMAADEKVRLHPISMDMNLSKLQGIVGVFPVAQRVKCLPAMQETWVRSLGRKDPLKKEIATHPGTLAWKIPWMKKPDRLQSVQSQSWTRLIDFTFFFFLSGDSEGQGSLACCSPWSHKE